MSNDLACVITELPNGMFRHYTYTTSAGSQSAHMTFDMLESAINWHNYSCESEYGLSIEINKERFMKAEASTEELVVRKFIRKPLIVEGIQVTSHNMKEVAAWCGGMYTQTASKRPYIRVQIRTAPTDRMSMAFAGDWILKSDIGFKIYSKRSFDRTFETLEEWDQASI